MYTKDLLPPYDFTHRCASRHTKGFHQLCAYLCPRLHTTCFPLWPFLMLHHVMTKDISCALKNVHPLHRNDLHLWQSKCSYVNNGNVESTEKYYLFFFFPWPGSLKIVYGFLQRFRVKCQEIVAVADFSCSFPNPPVPLHSSRLRPEITSQINYLQACQSQAVLKRIETKPSRCAF